MRSYFNTTNLTGTELQKAVDSAKTHATKILALYLHTRKPLSPKEVLQHEVFRNSNYPKHSYGARITTLCNDGHLIKTDELVPGLYNKTEHRWVINPKKYPSVEPGKQSSIFKEDKAA